jgi:hypothetical protein
VNPATPALVVESPTTPAGLAPPDGATDTPKTPVFDMGGGGGNAVDPEVPITPDPNWPVPLSQA